MKTKSVAIGLGLLLTAGLNAGCGHLQPTGITDNPLSPEQNTQEVVIQEPKKTTTKESKPEFTPLELKQSFTYVAGDFIKRGHNISAIRALELVLEQDGIPIPEKEDTNYSYPTLEDVKELAEQVIDKNLGNKAMKFFITYLAKTIHQEEKIEVASEIFKIVLDYPVKQTEKEIDSLIKKLETEPEESKKEMIKGFLYQLNKSMHVGQSFAHHTWIVYNLSLIDARADEAVKTNLLEMTHAKVKEYFLLNGTIDQYTTADKLFKEIEEAVSKVPSELEQKIELYDLALDKPELGF